MFVPYFAVVISVIIPYTFTQNTSFLVEWHQKAAVDDIPHIKLLHFQEKSYHIQSILKANFYQAQQYCRYYGMHLLSITSKEENDFLEKHIRDLGFAGQSFWTAVTRLPDANHWIWLSTGRQAIYTNWRAQEPNGYKSNEECVEMRIGNKGLQWNDIGCRNTFWFVCDYYWSSDCFSMLMNVNETSPLLDVR